MPYIHGYQPVFYIRNAVSGVCVDKEASGLNVRDKITIDAHSDQLP